MTSIKLMLTLATLWLIAVVLFVISLNTPVQASGQNSKKHPGTKVKAYVAESSKATCRDPVRVVGSQDVRQDAAEESAKKAWAEIVRWESGESFMDVNNATDYQSRCSRSSIGETLGVTLTRCEIIAKPCRPGLVKK